MSLADLGICWVFVGVGQRHEDHPYLEGPERASVDTRQPPQQIPAAFPGEAPYAISDTTTTAPTGPEAVTSLSILEGKCRYRPSYSRGDIGTRLM